MTPLVASPHEGFKSKLLGGLFLTNNVARGSQDFLPPCFNHCQSLSWGRETSCSSSLRGENEKRYSVLCCKSFQHASFANLHLAIALLAMVQHPFVAPDHTMSQPINCSSGRCVRDHTRIIKLEVLRSHHEHRSQKFGTPFAFKNYSQLLGLTAMHCGKRPALVASERHHGINVRSGYVFSTLSLPDYAKCNRCWKWNKPSQVLRSTVHKMASLDVDYGCAHSLRCCP